LYSARALEQCLLGGVDHVLNGSTDFVVRGLRATAWRHGAYTVDGLLNHSVHTGFDIWLPGSLIAKLGRTSYTGSVTGKADGVVQLDTSWVDLAVVSGSGFRGFRSLSRRRFGRFGVGGSSRFRLGVGFFTFWCRRFGFLEVSASSVSHVSNGTSHFDIVQRRVTTLGWHGTDTVNSVLDQFVLTQIDQLAPGTLVAKFGRTGHTGAVTGGTGGIVHLLTRLQFFDGIGVNQFEAGHRLDAGSNGFRGKGGGASTCTHGGGNQADQHDNNRDGHQESQSHGHKQLFRGFDHG